MMMVAAKDERDADIAVQYGKKNKKGKKQKAQQEKKDDEFDIDFQRINQFSFIQVSPPLAPSELEEKIAEIQKKRAHFHDLGEQMLKEEAEELNKAIELEQEEIKNQGEVVIEDEFRRGGRGRGRGGRGGFGGRGGRKFRNQQPESEEESDEYQDSDEEKEKIKPKPVQKKQNKKDLILDDGSYPTL
jgi:hypothetical protein